MAVPEGAIYEHRYAPAGEGDVRTTRQRGEANAIPEQTPLNQCPAKIDLWRSPRLAANCCHAARGGGRGFVH